MIPKCKEEKNVYSTEEKRIGTWIDGKPLYRKIITTTSTPNVNEDTIVANILNINLKSMNGVLIRESSIIDANHTYGNNSEQWSTLYYTNEGAIRHNTNIQQNCGVTLCIIVEYTKTTD